jgi:hypothetical protein
LACPKASSAKLWYAKYDNSPAFGDYAQIGGWSVPDMKQYLGDVTICGVDSDKNYKPWPTIDLQNSIIFIYYQKIKSKFNKCIVLFKNRIANKYPI